MAKKSAPSRPAVRKPVATGKQTTVALVRASRSENGTSSQPASTTSKSDGAPTAAPRAAKTVTSAQSAPKPASSKPVVVAPAERPRVPEVKAPRPTPAPKVATGTPRQTQISRAQATRVARARAVQHARAAHAIAPEQYGYVLNDLRLIIALAISMFTIILVLHFVLPQ